MPPNQEDPYEFIFDSATEQPKKQQGIGMQTSNQKLILSVLFVAGVIIALIIGFAVISSLGKTDNSSYVDVVAYQTELLRLSDQGLKEAKSPDTLSSTSTLKAFLQTDIATVTSYMSSSGDAPTDLQLSSKENKQVDALLTAAAQRNDYDKTLLEAIDATVAKYKSSLQQALSESTTTQQKAALESAVSNILAFEGQVAAN